MRESGTGYRKIVGLLVVVSMLFSSIGIVSSSATAVESASQETIETFDIEEYVPGKLTKNWLAVSDFYAGAPVVYLDQDTSLFIGIKNTGGGAGDDVGRLPR